MKQTRVNAVAKSRNGVAVRERFSKVICAYVPLFTEFSTECLSEVFLSVRHSRCREKPLFFYESPLILKSRSMEDNRLVIIPP